jgi:uncharacterized protein (TIGR03437 family)
MALRSADNGNAGPEGSPVTEGNAAQPGDTITLWAAGLGDVSDSSSTLRAGVPFEGEDGTVVHAVSAFINGRSAEVLSARLPEGAVGVYEVKVAIPPDLADDARAKVHLLQDGYVSNTVILPVQSVNR